MIAAPLLVQTAAWAELLPPLALLAGRNRSRPVRWVAAGALVSVLGNVAGRVAAHRLGNNHWLGYIDSALMYALFYAALSEWQVSPREARGSSAAIFMLLAAYIAVVALVEDVSTFSVYAASILSIGLLGGGIWTLVRRAYASYHFSLPATDWFWVIGGLALYGATTAAVQPVGRILLAAERLDLFTLVYNLRAVCVGIAFLLITAGCLLRPAPPDAIS